MKRLLSSITGLVLLVILSRAEYRGIRCLDCNDVSSPKECRDTTLCGQGEICFTRELFDHKGLRGFHLGCEDSKVCGLIEQSKILFGKRDLGNVNPAPVPTNMCFGCCSTDECNNNLCPGSAGGQVVTTVSPITTGLSCMDCEDVGSPDQCRQRTTCGSNEVCYTREYTDYSGRRGYRLGCESKARCAFYVKAQTMFGKRQLSEPAPPGECYECCSSDNCNTKLCLEKPDFQQHLSTPPLSTTKIAQLPFTSLNTKTDETTSGKPTTITTTTPTTTTTTQPTTTTEQINCRYNFTLFNHMCYRFDHVIKLDRYSARSYCRDLGGDLVSIHSKEEHRYIAQQLINLNATELDSFWTGGYWNHATAYFENTDGTRFNYSSWMSGNPRFWFSNHQDIFVKNPAHDPQHKSAPMWEPDTYNYKTLGLGIMCKSSPCYWWSIC